MADDTIPTPPDGTRHGPVPPMTPAPIKPDPGRAPLPNPSKPGDNPVFPPDRDPFPEQGTEKPPTSHPKSM